MVDQIVQGIGPIETMVRDSLKSWGVSENLESEVALYVNKSYIESNFGEANHLSGNGVVVGTWQVDQSLVTTLLGNLESGFYSQDIDPEIQKKMAEDFRDAMSKAGGNQAAALRDQSACLAMAMALQADNNNTLRNKGIDPTAIEAANPDHKFALSYIKHQLPPKEVEDLYKAIRDGDMNKPISELVGPGIRSSNPSTYNGVTNLGQFLELLGNKQELAPSATASAGITMPSFDSATTTVADIRRYDPEFAKELETIESGFNADNPNHEAIAQALQKLNARVEHVYNETNVDLNSETQMMAMRLGPYTAAVLLSGENDDKTLLKDAQATYASNGQPINISEESIRKFIAELEPAGVRFSTNNYDNLTVGELREKASEYMQVQVKEAAENVTRRQNGELTPEENKEATFFDMLTNLMGPEFGMIASALVGFMSIIGGDEGKAKFLENTVESAASIVPDGVLQSLQTAGVEQSDLEANANTDIAPEVPASLKQQAPQPRAVSTL